jgi:hypothetical protein
MLRNEWPLLNNCFTEEVQHLSSADLAVLQQMKSTIDNQRDAIRSKNSEIESVKSDLEAVCEMSCSSNRLKRNSQRTGKKRM